MWDSLAKLLHREEPAQAEPGLAPFLIVGLGNPGREYRETRHNAGFMLVDSLAEAGRISLARVQNKAIVGQGELAGRRIILAKPQTYMNLSGQAVIPLMRFYKVPQNQLLVAHDDLDLPVGSIRLRPGGGSAGQKGIASIIEKLGSPDFARLRLGIGRPPGRMDPADYVLHPFDRQDREIFDQVLERAREAVRTFIQAGLEPAMNQYNGPVSRN